MRRRKSWWLTFLMSAVLLTLSALGEAQASRGHPYRHRRGRRGATAIGGPAFRGALLEDADSGKVLYSYNADMPWPPASMAKMMMLLVAEDQIRSGRFSYSSPVVISSEAAYTGGTRLGMRPGDVYPLGELMKAALVKSANDAAVAVAEKIAGSTENCVRMMNEKARALGLTHTQYNTVDGLPPSPGNDVDVTDALDLATIARAIIHTTGLLRWSSQEECPFDAGERMLHNTNHLIGHFEGCDGIKTGFTYHAGFNLTATAKRGALRLISVVLGTSSNYARFHQAGQLLEWGFDNYIALAWIKKGEPLPLHVQLNGVSVQPIAADDVRLVVPKVEASAIKVEYDVPTEVIGPVLAGSPLGEIDVRNGAQVVSRVAVLSPMPAPVPVEDKTRLFNTTSVVHEGAD